MGETPIAIKKPKLRKSVYRQRVSAVFGKTTLDERAQHFGMHRATMARIEGSHIEPHLGKAMYIARLLGVTVENLWSASDEAA